MLADIKDVRPAQSAGRAAPPRRSRVSGLVRREQRAGALFATPAAIAVVAIIVVPLVYAVWMSLHRTPLAGAPVFAGLSEYGQVLGTPEFWGSLLVTAKVIIPTIAVELFLGTSLALLLHNLPGGNVLRLLIIVPLLLSPAIIGADWAVMLNRESGIADYLLSLVHLPQISFLTSGSAVLPTLDGVYAWQNLGFTLIVVTAGLANIPRELTDAVVIDGATYIQRLRYLLLPMLLPFFGIIVFWRFVTLIEDYGLVGLLT
ncbi:MAG TPA: sugar ABC transporter permease, partial [Acidimicrobiales bacterium]|nr:sugar ABC transporter permease [Acidimicrobiales bacterium]